MTAPEDEARNGVGLAWALVIALVAAVGWGAYGVQLRQELTAVANRCGQVQSEAVAATGVLRDALATAESRRDELRR